MAFPARVASVAASCLLLLACADQAKSDPEGSASKAPLAPHEGQGNDASASAGTLWDRLCAAVPPGADHEATLAALVAVPGAKEEQPDMFALLEDAPRCQRLQAAKSFGQQALGKEWVCPALDDGLGCDPKDDLEWICARARDFTGAARGPLSPADHTSFVDAVMLGRRPPAPGSPAPERPKTRLGMPSSASEGEPEHDFHPDLAYGGQAGCELVTLLEGHAKAAGAEGWSCPELATATGCKR